MTLREAIEQFIAWRQSLGSRFVTQSYVLRHFLKKVDGEIGCDDVTLEQVCSYLTGEGPSDPDPRNKVLDTEHLLALCPSAAVTQAGRRCPKTNQKDHRHRRRTYIAVTSCGGFFKPSMSVVNGR